MSESTYTVGDFRRLLEFSADDAKLTFGGGLTVYRARHWDDGSVFIEFNEPEAHLGDNFKRENPHIKVVFTKLD
jgi:hypothetical protein